MKQVKFLGTIYILAEVLPKLSDLSKVFQAGKFNFSAILPAVARTKSQLETIKAGSTALDALEKGIDGIGFIATDMKMSRKVEDELVGIQGKYIDSLIKNITKRFEYLESNGVLLAFGIFDPVLVPGTDDVLASHFFPEDKEANDRLQSQWNQMKYHVNENVKAAIPEEVRNQWQDWHLHSMVLVPTDEEQSELPAIFWHAASHCRGRLDTDSQQCMA